MSKPCSTNQNKGPPCLDGYYEKLNKKNEKCCYKQSKSNTKHSTTNVKKTVSKCSTNQNKGPPCLDGYYEKLNKKNEKCCFKKSKSITKHSTKNVKELIIYNLETLITYHQIKKEPFKVKAYQNALDKISFKDNVKSIDDVNDITGTKIQSKLQTMINTKKNLPKVEKLLEEYNIAFIDELMKIHGVGPAKAYDLIYKHHIKSIDELKNKQELLNNIQKRGLKYFDDVKLKIPRSEMILHDKFIHKFVPSNNLDITGSYRRGLSKSSDIDVLLKDNENNDNSLTILINKLLENNYLLKDGILSQGKHKFMGMCKLPNHKHARRIDIMLTPKDEYPFALLYFTGSKQFNVKMRSHALSKGYSLNEQGITKKKQKISQQFTSEKDIFDFLDYPYVPPQER